MSDANAVTPVSFTKRMSEFFGRKPNQSLGEFSQELKTLTDQDKKDLVKLFNDAGMPTELK